MKKLLFLTVILLAAASFYADGQELMPQKNAKGQWGYVDENGKLIIPCMYDDAGDFSEGLAAVNHKKLWGFIDKTGIVVIPFKYAHANNFSEGLAVVSLTYYGKYGYIDKTGKEVIPFKFYGAGNFSEGLAAIKNYSGKCGFIDKTGKEVIPIKYDDVRYFSEGLAAVSLKGKYGFIDKIGNEIIPMKYDDAGDFSEGLAAVSLKGKYGFVDKTGNEVISMKYDDTGGFSEGLAGVKLNGKYGFIDKTGKEVISINYTRNEALSKKQEYLLYDYLDPFFSNFAKNYVEDQINEWQKKDRFETTAEWQQRVNENARKAKIEELTQQAGTEFIAFMSEKTNLNLTFNPDSYDADNETYLIKSKQFGDLLVHIPRKEAPAFETAWESVIKTPTYSIDNDLLALSELTFTMPDGKTYKYSNQSSLNYTVAQIDYKFDPIEINIEPQAQTTPKGNQTIGTVNVQVGKSDVDMDIPKTAATHDKTFAVIIANENYKNESQVPFAKNDGEVFKKYCTQTLGIPEKNAHLVTDATLNDIRKEINWLSNIVAAYEGDVNIIFYYAGHGIPDESSKNAYLLPIDGYGSDVITGYKLDDLYQKLGAMPANAVTVFVDACFSGAQRSGDMLASARGVAIKATQGKPVGNMVVFTAAQGDETAFPYHEKGHGLFTYFLLKKLQETQGDVTLGELGDYLYTNVRQQSLVVNSKNQTPTVTSSEMMESKWRNLKLSER